jgi:hypothetical protein
MPQGSCSCLLHPAKPLPASVADMSCDRQITTQARRTHHKRSDSLQNCHEFLSLTKRVSKSANSRESRREKLPASRPQAPTRESRFSCSVGNEKKSMISLRQREAFVACRATTTISISRHQHGNRSGFQVVVTFLIEPTRARCATRRANNETAAPKTDCKAVCSRAADRIENGRGGGRSTSGLGAIVVGWA